MPIEVTTADGARHLIQIADGDSDQTMLDEIQQGRSAWLRTEHEDEWVKVDHIVSVRKVTATQHRTAGFN